MGVRVSNSGFRVSEFGVRVSTAFMPESMSGSPVNMPSPSDPWMQILTCGINHLNQCWVIKNATGKNHAGDSQVGCCTVAATKRERERARERERRERARESQRERARERDRESGDDTLAQRPLDGDLHLSSEDGTT